MGEDFGEHKRYDFFVRNLLNVNPRMERHHLQVNAFISCIICEAVLLQVA